MKNLAILLAVALWSLVIIQACQIQFADQQKLDQLALEQALKLDAARFETAGDTITAKIILDTLQNVQAVQEQELGTISVSADTAQVFEYNQ